MDNEEKSADNEKPAMEDTCTRTSTANPISITVPDKEPVPDKVKVHFVAVGSAPLMKKTKFQISADQRFAAVISFLRKMLKLTDSGSSLFLYCNSAFMPSPDELLRDLNECFSIRGELVIHYSLQEAWG
jgi:ubiquitin-like protein ATG12